MSTAVYVCAAEKILSSLPELAMCTSLRVEKLRRNTYNQLLSSLTGRCHISYMSVGSIPSAYFRRRVSPRKAVMMLASASPKRSLFNMLTNAMTCCQQEYKLHDPTTIPGSLCRKTVFKYMGFPTQRSHDSASKRNVTGSFLVPSR